MFDASGRVAKRRAAWKIPPIMETMGIATRTAWLMRRRSQTKKSSLIETNNDVDFAGSTRNIHSLSIYERAQQLTRRRFSVNMT